MQTIQSYVNLVITNQTIELLPEVWRMQVEDGLTNQLVPKWLANFNLGISACGVAKSKSVFDQLH